jgi:hypothetical protein
MTDQEETQQAAVATPPNQDVEVTLTLKVSAVNTILVALDEVPHKFSRALIDTIVSQAQAQIQTPAA